ncbi:hypothetical protein NUACC26_090580 [Scytonema sp. NUACC26]
MITYDCRVGRCPPTANGGHRPTPQYLDFFTNQIGLLQIMYFMQVEKIAAIQENGRESDRPPHESIGRTAPKSALQGVDSVP